MWVARESTSLVASRAESISRRSSERSSGKTSGTLLLAREQLVRVQPVRLLGRDAAGRRVRMREQAARLELGELVADRRRRDAQTGALDEVPRADRLAGRDVLLDDAREEVALPRGQPVRLTHAPFAASLGQQVRRHAAAEHAAARGQRQRRRVRVDEPEALQALERRAVEHVAEPCRPGAARPAGARA